MYPSPNTEIISTAERQTGAINIQRCSVENQKGAIAVHSVYGDSALLALNWRHAMSGGGGGGRCLSPPAQRDLQGCGDSGMDS